MKEKIKTAALIANGLLMAVLFTLSVSLGVSVDPSLGPLYTLSRWLRGENTVSQVQEEESDPAAYPLAVSAFQQGDLYYAYTQQPVSAIYALLRPTLEEALGSMGEKKTVQREDYYRVLLEEQGFLLEYDGQVPLTAMRAWSGASPGEDELAFSRLVLLAEEDRVDLLLETEEGEWFRFSTAAASEKLQTALEECDPDGSYFAMEDPNLSVLVPDQPVPSSAIKLPVYECKVADVITDAVSGGEMPRALLECFSMNPYLAKRYAAGEDMAVFVQGNYSLRLSGDGTVQFTVDGGEGLEGESGENTLVGLIGRGWQVAQDARDSAGSPLDLSLKSIQKGAEEEKYTILFSCRASGVPLSSQQVTIHVREGVIVSMEMSLLSLTQTGKKTLLPYSLAAAAREGSSAVRLQCRYTLQEGKLTPYLSYATVKEG